LARARLRGRSAEFGEDVDSKAVSVAADDCCSGFASALRRADQYLRASEWHRQGRIEAHAYSPTVPVENPGQAPSIVVVTQSQADIGIIHVRGAHDQEVDHDLRGNLPARLGLNGSLDRLIAHLIGILHNHQVEVPAA
jgi:hypothetical protein